MDVALVMKCIHGYCQLQGKAVLVVNIAAKGNIRAVHYQQDGML